MAGWFREKPLSLLQVKPGGSLMFQERRDLLAEVWPIVLFVMHPFLQGKSLQLWVEETPVLRLH